MFCIDIDIDISDYVQPRMIELLISKQQKMMYKKVTMTYCDALRGIYPQELRTTTRNPSEQSVCRPTVGYETTKYNSLVPTSLPLHFALNTTTQWFYDENKTYFER